MFISPRLFNLFLLLFLSKKKSQTVAGSPWLRNDLIRPSHPAVTITRPHVWQLYEQEDDDRTNFLSDLRNGVDMDMDIDIDNDFDSDFDMPDGGGWLGLDARSFSSGHVAEAFGIDSVKYWEK